MNTRQKILGVNPTEPASAEAAGATSTAGAKDHLDIGKQSTQGDVVMGEQTGISWADKTWSPWYGCTQVSMGDKGACVGCYARFMSETRHGRVVFGGPGRGEGTRDVRADSAWKDPIRWNRTSPGAFIFPSMCDPFDNHQDLVEPRRRFFDLIRATPNLTWLLLTKRPQNIVRMATTCMTAGADGKIWPSNAAIGFTAVTQAEMDRDGRHALAAYRTLGTAPFLFWSGEPLMGPAIIPGELLALAGRFWAITGGETNQGSHRARPSNPDWFRSLRDQCRAAEVPYHHKQNGEWVAYGQHNGKPDENLGLPGEPREDRDVAGERLFRVGKKAAGRTLDGVVHDARPLVAA
jgi:protein gp37